MRMDEDFEMFDRMFDEDDRDRFWDEGHDYPDDKDCEDCPECGEGLLRYQGKEKYGADRDGNRWEMRYHYECDNCGYGVERA